MTDPLPMLVCTGRAYDTSGRPMPDDSGEPCGDYLEHRPPVGPEMPTRDERVAAYAMWARTKGWRFGELVDGLYWRHAMCPACAKPDPVTAAHCRDLTRSVRYPGRAWS